MKKLNLKVHIHGSKEKINKETDIYLVNTFGQTQSFFKVCKIVFLGGSIIKHGGQNPLEAARYGCKILHGPNVSNFNEIYKFLHKQKISKKVINLNQLSFELDKTFKNKNRNKNLMFKIKNLGDKILTSTLKQIDTYINK
jgi:3-deoxy-D-manno-octulosonic-acid transferase